MCIMQQFFLIFGITLVLVGVATLFHLAWRARAVKNLDETHAKKIYTQLIIQNFAGLGLAILGFIMIILSRIF